MSLTTKQLTNALDIIYSAKINICHTDYVNIWGEHLGDHIWRQEGNDLIRIWKSGLQEDEKQKFVEYILNGEFEGSYNPVGE